MRKKRVPDGWWNVKEHCIEEALKYKTRKEFREAAGKCYQICKKNGWLEEFTWLETNGKHPYGWYDVYEHCEEEAKKYKTLKEFTAANPTCVMKSREHGWLEKFTWLKTRFRKIAQYTLDGEFIRIWDKPVDISNYLKMKVSTDIVKCCEFRRNQSKGYRWLYVEDMERAGEIFEKYPIERKNGGYTEEEISEYIKNNHIKTRKELYTTKEGNRYYRAAERLGILDKLPLDRELNPYNGNMYWVYAYFFKETHSVYVGITFRKEREKEHNGECKEKSEGSAVWEHAIENNLQVPDPVHLEDDLDPETALFLENEYREYYRLMGWNILNKAPTGVSSGSLGQCKKISNKEIRETASKYEYVGDFKKDNESLYAIAQQRGILKEIIEEYGLKYKQAANGTYTEEVCYNMARECRSSAEFKKKSASAHSTSYMNGWRRQYWWFIDSNHIPIIASNGMKIKVLKDIGSAAEWFGCTKWAIRYRIKSGYVFEGWRVEYINEYDIDLKIPDFEHRLVV